MAFIVAAPRGTFEIRESHSTPAGPRSRTLATFKELDGEALEKASARAANALDFEQLRRMARRAGASVAPSPVDRAARDLVAELAQGRNPSPLLRRLLADTIEGNGGESAGQAPPQPLSDAARSAAAWLTATPRRRGEALHDLLLLADALPDRLRERAPGFPRLESAST
jgi:hypothetical protein